MQPRFSSRLDGIQTSAVRQMFEMASRDAIHLGLGEPDFAPPAHIREAVTHAMATGKNKYGSIRGVPELRDALATYANRYRPRADFTEKNVVVTMGGSEALMATAGAFYDKGDEVLVPDPGFVFYAPHARIAGATPVPYPVTQEHQFIPQVEEIVKRITPRTKFLVVNSPGNPTGAVFPRETVKAIADVARDHRLLIISDEVYDRVVYDRPHTSFLEFTDDVIFVYSFSKTFAIPGWRVGFLAAREEYLEKLTILHYFTVACPATPLQYGVLAGLNGPQDFVTGMVAEFRKRRDTIVQLLNDTPGFECVVPQGAFYVLPRFHFDIPDGELALLLLKAGVVCSPGSAFGSGGAGHLRFSYATSQELIRKGIDIVRSTVEKLPVKSSG